MKIENPHDAHPSVLIGRADEDPVRYRIFLRDIGKLNFGFIDMRGRTMFQHHIEVLHDDVRKLEEEEEEEEEEEVAHSCIAEEERRSELYKILTAQYCRGVVLFYLMAFF